MRADHIAGLFLVDLGVLILLGLLLGAMLARVGQPPVMGEILAGILVGPSLLGAAAPATAEQLFPPEVVALLTAVGNLGLVVFVFFIGLRINRVAIRRQLSRVSTLFGGSLILPFLAGVLIAVPLSGSDSGAGGQSADLAYCLFIGTAFSVTAFPVLARILVSEGLEETNVGVLALAVAAVLDIAGWILLSAALTLHAGNALGDIARLVLELGTFVATVLLLVIPVLRVLLRQLEDRAPAKLAMVMVAILGSSGATQLIGLHSVLGALVLGLAFPRDEAGTMLGAARHQLESVAGSVLVPIYFAVAGMAVDVADLAADQLLTIVVLVAAMTITKVVGTSLAARLTGLDWADGLSLGVLLNTRGLVEIVVLNIGLGAALIQQDLYTQLILAAIVASLLTTPIIRLLRRGSQSLIWQKRGTAPVV